jgi:hypothetical protein
MHSIIFAHHILGGLSSARMPDAGVDVLPFRNLLSEPSRPFKFYLNIYLPIMVMHVRYNIWAIV